MPQKRKYPKVVSFTMDEDLALALHNVKEGGSFTNYSDAARYLMRMALAADPLDGALLAAKHQAFSEVRIWSIQRMTAAMKEIYDTLRAAQTDPAQQNAIRPTYGG